MHFFRYCESFLFKVPFKKKVISSFGEAFCILLLFVSLNRDIFLAKVLTQNL